MISAAVPRTSTTTTSSHTRPVPNIIMPLMHSIIEASYSVA
ncbi:hypothetical protein [Mesorhizobium sp.]|nr:hypothetical protein [Mesorhizobium sp.]